MANFIKDESWLTIIAEDSSKIVDMVYANIDGDKLLNTLESASHPSEQIPYMVLKYAILLTG